MLNNNIRIDLHIHSKASEYKEEKDYVKESNINNVEVLLEKLQQNNINLFSITDHNRFDYKLYTKIKELINQEPYDNVKNILPGIEFDVNLEEDSLQSCHIVCIFDDTDDEKIKPIMDCINSVRLLEGKEDSYTIEEFERILCKIGTNVLLIAHQKSSLSASGSSKHHSLSESVKDPVEWIKTGYINALEYQSPKVQGIIKNSLKEMKSKFATVTGSDCHVWSEYPKKDALQQEKDYVTKIKSLPTFKGLVMAFTSPSTRFDRKEEKRLDNYFDSIKIDGNNYELSTGINAIIGENGSGKSFLLSKINGENKLKEYKIIEKNNEVKITNQIVIIKQGDIKKRVNEGKLLDNDSEYYEEIPTLEEFKLNIRSYVENLKQYILKNIKKNENEKAIRNKKIDIKEYINTNNYYISLNDDRDEIENEPQKREIVLNEEYTKLLKEYNENQSFYEGTKKEKITTILTNLQSLISEVKNESEQVKMENKIINVITSVFREYTIKIDKERNSQEKEKEEYKKEIRSFANDIKKYLMQINEKNEYPVPPKEIEGISVKSKLGFKFIKEAKYNNINLEIPLQKYIFIASYQNIESIKRIMTNEEYTRAVAGVTSFENINEKISQNVERFIEEYTKEETTIRKENGTDEIGTTPGEVALTFYELILSENNDKSVILIDQPEDDISMKRIEKYMIEFFNSVRDKKQVIFVTHNPLLVVNLDVDNVIYVSKNKNNKININCGCLESSNIIDLVSQNLDGGREAIERRLKIYGNN